MYGNTATGANHGGAASVGGAKKRSGLMDKLRVRHQAALTAFREAITELNAALDAQQLQCLATLKADLAHSHAESEAILADERTRLEGHEQFLAEYASQFKENGLVSEDTDSSVTRLVRDGDVLSPFYDVFHAAALDPSHTTVAADAEGVRAAMKAERLRLLGRAVLLRQLYSTRAAAVAAARTQLEETEVRRREALQENLRELMFSLAKISYSSVTASHALSQRILHSANEQIALNYATSLTLLAQLGQREVLQQRVYAGQMAALLVRSRERMERSCAYGARTALQSAALRRPADRMDAVERVSAISARARRDGVNFLASLGAVVATLRRTSDDGIVLEGQGDRSTGDLSGDTLAVPPRPECGGTGPNGWLRMYSADPRTDPFPNGCEEVVDEWRMKVTVVLGNVQASCREVVEVAAEQEAARKRSVAAIQEAFQDALTWLRTPLEEEPTLLTAASINEGPNSTTTENSIDDVYRPLIEVDVSTTPERARAERERVLGPVSRIIDNEGEWFVSLIDKGLQESYRAFEGILSVAFASVLRWFEKSTHELVNTARGALNPVRTFYIRRCEASLDVADELSQREAEYAATCERLSRAGSLAAAEALFAEGLKQLESIAAAYTTRQQRTLADLSTALRSVTAAAGACCDHLMEKLGLESVESTVSRLEVARQEKLEAALAEIMREQQLLQQQQQHTAGASTSVSGQSSRRRPTKKEGGGTSTSSAAAVDPEAQALLREQQAEALSRLEEEIPKEVVEYAQLTSARGSVFNVVGPLSIVDEDAVARAAALAPHPPRTPQASVSDANPSAAAIPTRSSKRSFYGSQQQGPKAQGAAGAGKDSRQTPATAAVDAVPNEFIATYTPMMADTILVPAQNFLPKVKVDAWKAQLREELLNWLLALRESVEDVMREYCAKARTEVEQETSKLLRRHRRRPAALQADVYEARVRELEDVEGASEKYAQRFRERLTKLSTQWHDFAHSKDLAEHEAASLAELAKIEAQAATAASLSALQSQDRRHNAVCVEYADGYAESCATLLANLARAKAVLEEECRRSLTERAHALAEEELGEGVTLESAVAADPTSVLVRGVLSELEERYTAVEKEAEAAVAERRAAAEAARAKYASVFKDNAAELQLLASIQEAFSGLRTQLHTFQMSSAAAEGVLVDAVGQLERLLTDALPRLALTDAVKEELQKRDAGKGDHETNASKPLVVGGELSQDTVQAAAEALSQALQETRMLAQRGVRSCSLAAVLDSLSRLREMLYVRGVTLDALAQSVEMVLLVPEHYIEPSVVVKGTPAGGGGSSPPKASGGAATVSARGGGGANNRRTGRAASSSTTSQGSVSSSGRPTTPQQQTPLLPLPQVLSALAQFSGWASQTVETVERLMAAHVAQHPPPFHRSLPGTELLPDGSTPPLDDPVAAARAAAEAFCAAQQERLSGHVTQSKKVYYQLVHRVQDVVLQVPRFAAANLYHLAAAALTRRLEEVLRIYGAVAEKAAAAKEKHRRAVKVSLGSRTNGETLSRLAAAEAARQRASTEAIRVFWGLALREAQDEGDVHTARCYTTVNTFFHLLRGLVLPDALLPFDWQDGPGHHRGLRHLMKLRARLEAEAEDEHGDGGLGADTGKRERRLQETLLLPRQDGGSGGGGHKGGAAVAGGNGARGAAAAGHAPPPPQRITYAGMPLLRVKPLDAFNAAQPNNPVAPLNTVYGYFPGLAEAEAAAANATAAPVAAAAPHAQGTASSGRRGVGAAGTSKRRSVEASSAYGAEGTAPVTPAIIAPSTRLHRDTVAAARDTAEVVSQEVTVVAQELSGAFGTWEGREANWRQSWEVMLKQLQGGTGSQTTWASTSVGAAPDASRAAGGKDQRNAARAQ